MCIFGKFYDALRYSRRTNKQAEQPAARGGAGMQKYERAYPISGEENAQGDMQLQYVLATGNAAFNYKLSMLHSLHLWVLRMLVMLRPKTDCCRSPFKLVQVLRQSRRSS